jgi:hypothetical protein
MNNPFFEFVIVVILLSFIYKLLNAWLHRKPPVDAAEPGKESMIRRLEQLEERVRVLERIVTDERFDLKQQFKDLAS